MLQSRWGCSSGCSGDQWGLADKEGGGDAIKRKHHASCSSARYDNLTIFAGNDKGTAMMQRGNKH